MFEQRRRNGGRASYSARVALVTLLASACLDTTEPPSAQLIGDGTPILFVGNSYLYAVDIPGIVQALADSARGERLAVMSIANANYALVDHVNDGVATREIAKRQWKYVVLQQGWTPAGVCRDTLRLATKALAAAMKPVGAHAALFEAWAPASRPGQFPGTIGSYRLAAQDVDGLLLPIAEAWQAALAKD